MNLFSKLNEYWKKQGSEFDSFYSASAFSPKKIVGAFLDRRSEILQKMLGDISGKKILDLACGSGIQMVDLAPRCKEIIGVDISDELLAIAKKELEKLKNNNWSLVSSDATRLPLKDGEIDLVYSLGLLDYVEDIPVILRECRRVLRDDGSIIFTVPRRPSLFAFFRTQPGIWLRRKLFNLPPIANALKKSELNNLLASVGLRIISAKSLWSTMWIVKVEKL